MTGDVYFVITLLAALGCGLMAGVFFAFSAFVMTALARLPKPHGMAAMQSINAAVLNPWFFTAFFGTAIACLAVVIAAVSRWSGPAGAYGLAGAVLYLLGTFLVTVLFNVPKNEALAAVGATDPGAARLWDRYLLQWTTWNHLRTAAALAATALLILTVGELAR